MSGYDYFGVCPHCHKNDGFINISRSHWFLCDEHKVKWCVGSNLFSSWRNETEDEQRRAYDQRGVGNYAEVRPYFLPPSAEDRVIAHVGHVDPSDSQSPYSEDNKLPF
jgi:hypothetical protein